MIGVERREREQETYTTGLSGSCTLRDGRWTLLPSLLCCRYGRSRANFEAAGLHRKWFDRGARIQAAYVASYPHHFNPTTCIQPRPLCIRHTAREERVESYESILQNFLCECSNPSERTQKHRPHGEEMSVRGEPVPIPPLASFMFSVQMFTTARHSAVQSDVLSTSKSGWIPRDSRTILVFMR